MKAFSSKTLVAIEVLTVALVAVVLIFALGGDDGEESAAPAGKTATANADPEAVSTFQDTCGTCHTLSAAGTDGDVGPVLDDYAYDRERVLTTIEQGPGEMPPNLLEGEDAEAVADLIAGDDPTLANPSDAAEQDGPSS
jgi:mono/diheme cytochrome c family protein